jgi:MFS family permease
MSIFSFDRALFERYPYYSPRSWFVVLIAALFFFFEFIQMNMFNAIAPGLIKSFSLSASDLGNLSASYFYGNVAFLIPAGILLDRVSTKKLLTAAISVCVVCTYLFAISTTQWEAVVFRFITGMGASFCMLSAVRLASRWFPPQRIALIIGLVVTMAMAGGMLAQTPLAYLSHWLGWRHAVMINAILGLVFTVIIFIFVQDYPASIAAQQQKERQVLKETGFLSSIALAFKNRQNWFAGIYTNFLSFPVVILGAAWGSLYLMHVRHLTHLQTTNITQMIFLGMIFGSPIMGLISDKLQRRKLPMIVGAVLTLIVILWIMLPTNLSVSELLWLFFFLGFLSGTQVITYPLIVESNPREITTTAEGLTCFLIMSAGLFQFIFGVLVDANWHGKMLAGHRVYSAHAYQAAMWLLPAMFVVALLMSFGLKETFCRNAQK